MKQFSFYLKDTYSETFFPKERVKSKIQIINILLESIRYILLNPNVEKSEAVAEIKVVIDKMSRIFFFSENKYYSIVFPFKITEEDNNYYLYTKNDIEINSYFISKVKSAINCDSFSDSCVLDFADSLFDYDNGDEQIWDFIKELMLLEDGYIRYDSDLKGYEEAKAKGYPNRHPINHYDLFYTSPATFKIGLDNNHSLSEMIDLVDIKTDCRFIKN